LPLECEEKIQKHDPSSSFFVPTFQTRRWDSIHSTAQAAPRQNSAPTHPASKFALPARRTALNMPWFSARVSQDGGGGGAASSNWSYITQEMKDGPRGHEVMYRTMDAKAKYKLTTRDIECIEGGVWWILLVAQGCKTHTLPARAVHRPIHTIGCQLTQ
jgi:hypothetical protein